MTMVRLKKIHLRPIIVGWAAYRDRTDVGRAKPLFIGRTPKAAFDGASAYLNGEAIPH